MIKKYLFILAIIVATSGLEAQNLPDWENPDVNGVDLEYNTSK